MKKNNKLIINVLIFALVIIAGFSRTKNFTFVMTMLSMIAVLIKAKISLFSVVSLFISYICIPVAVKENFDYSYGILGVNNIPLYGQNIYFSILLFNMAIYFLCDWTNVLEKEKELYRIDMKKNKFFCFGCCLVAIVFSIVAFPRFGGERFNSLLPGNAWNHLVITALMFLIFYLKDSWCARIATIFAIAWFLLHGERVDVLGYLIGASIILINRYNIKMNRRNIIIGLGGAAILFFTLIIIGQIRTGEAITLKGLLLSIVCQPTASDIAYVFNSSIHFSKTEELYKGISYLKNLSVFIPLLENPYLVEYVLNDMYGAPGGEFYLSEAIMNFGRIAGSLISISFFCIILYLLLNSKNLYFRIITIFIICTCPRIIWYGKNYIVTAITIFIPLALLVNYFILKLETKKKGGKKDEQSIHNYTSI